MPTQQLGDESNHTYAFGLDPRFWCSVRVFVSHLHRLPSIADGIYQLNDRPVHRFEIMGVVTAIDLRSKYGRFVVDDGTAIISCIGWHADKKAAALLPTTVSEAEPRPATNDWSGAQLGDLVRIQGRLSEFLDERQITIAEMFVCPSIDDEILWKLATIHLHRYVYPLPLPSLHKAVASRPQPASPP